MKELKQAIENTLINNLESHYYKDMNGDLFSGIDFDSIQTCADYISKEIVELMVDFNNYYNNLPQSKKEYSIEYKTGTYRFMDVPQDKLAEEFLTQRYKKETNE